MAEHRPTIHAPHYAVSSAHYLASAAAQQMFQRGGNATDAGVAAGLALNVLLPEWTGIDGVAPILVYSGNTGQVSSIAGLGPWPKAADPAMFTRQYGGRIPPGILGTTRRVVPGALDAVDRLGSWGPTVLLSDGDVAFQPRKIVRSGLQDAVDGRVLIYVHKDAMLGEVERLYPARHYVMVDDKVRILAALKAHWGTRVTTVFPRQGHYALDGAVVAAHAAPDLTLERIGELADLDLSALVPLD